MDLYSLLGVESVAEIYRRGTTHVDNIYQITRKTWKICKYLDE